MITGHRDIHGAAYYSQLKRYIGSMCKQHHDLELITGMAIGADQTFGWLGIHAYRPIPVHAYLPYYSQCSCWSLPKRKEYYRLLERCRTVRVVNIGKVFESAAQAVKMIRNNTYLIPYDQWIPKDATKALMARNKAMVADCDEAVAIIVPSRIKSGTSATVRILKEAGKPVTEIEPII